MRIVDLFSGLEGWGGPHRAAHTVATCDIEARFEPDVVADVLEPDLAERLIDKLGGRPDLVLASPPCEAFSVLQIGRNWTGPKDVPAHTPKTDKARLALRIAERTVELIGQLDPAFFVIENPRAKLRKLPVVAHLERRTVTYCQYGEPFQKPTDLWGGFPPSLVLAKVCGPGAPCHLAAPRGSTTGIQGKLEASAAAMDDDELAELQGIMGEIAARRAETSPKGFYRRPDDYIEAQEIQRRRNRRGNLTMHKRQKREVYSQADLAALRAKVPEALSRAVVEAAERDLAAGRRSEAIPTLWGARLGQASW